MGIFIERGLGKEVMDAMGVQDTPGQIADKIHEKRQKVLGPKAKRPKDWRVESALYWKMRHPQVENDYGIKHGKMTSFWTKRPDMPQPPKKFQRLKGLKESVK